MLTSKLTDIDKIKLCYTRLFLSLPPPADYIPESYDTVNSIIVHRTSYQKIVIGFIFNASRIHFSWL